MTRKFSPLQSFLFEKAKEQERAHSNFSKGTFADVVARKLQKPKLTLKITIKKTKEEETLEGIKRKVSHWLVSDKTIQTNKILKGKLRTK